MTNPNNTVRVRARNGGRASVYEANGWCQAYTIGLLKGNGVTQNTSADMNVLVGGSSAKPDVVIAENPSGYKVALDLVSQQAVAITAPASNSRISAIVAYTDDLSLATTQDTVTGSPSSCGLIVVNGTASGSPSAPSDAQIRTAITADGATGSQAAYCVIATILVASGTTTITNSLITVNRAGIGSDNVDFTTFADYSTSEVNTGVKWIDGSIIYKKTVHFGFLPNNTSKNVAHSISNLKYIITFFGMAYSNVNQRYMPLPAASPTNLNSAVLITINPTNITVATGTDRTSDDAYVTIFYTKTS